MTDTTNTAPNVIRCMDALIDEITTELPATFYDSDGECDSWCEQCGVTIARKLLPEIAAALRAAKIEALREAAKNVCAKQCREPDSPYRNRENYKWYHLKGCICVASPIHGLIAELEGEGEDK